MIALVLRSDGRVDRGRIEVEGDRIDVDEHRPRAEPGDAAGGGEERVGGGDDLVARSDAKRHHRHQQRVGPRRDADGVLHAEQGGEFALEPLHLGAHDELLAVADARDGREDRVAERRYWGR